MNNFKVKFLVENKFKGEIEIENKVIGKNGKTTEFYLAISCGTEPASFEILKADILEAED